MEDTPQIEPSREDVFPQQILESPLVPGNQPIIGDEDTPASRTVSSNHRPPKRSSRGAMLTASQPRLKSTSPNCGGEYSARNSNSGMRQQDPFGETEKLIELQPMDRGFGAWSYVAATFAMYIVVWGKSGQLQYCVIASDCSRGFPYSFPIFQTYLSNGPKATYPDSVAIRLLAPGIQDILEGILFPLLPAASQHRLALIVAGITIITAALLAASYATAAWQIALTQGVLFGVGGILLNFVHVSIFSEWFDKQRGKAMGIIWTGWRVGALGFPLICQWLLEQHGFSKTIRVLIPPMLTLLAPAMVLLRGRYHGAIVSSQPAKPSVSKLQALRTPTVLYYLLATNLYFLVVNIPKMFVTTFAADIGLSGSAQAASLVLLTLSEMLVTYLCGWLSDKHHHGHLMGPLAICTSVTHVLGLGYARSKTGVFFYACIVGLLSGGMYNFQVTVESDNRAGYSNFLFTFYNEASQGSGSLFTAIHGLFSFFRGASILSVGPVGAQLLRRAPPVDTAAFALAKYQVRATLIIS
jgi:hypothetical protein